MNNAANSKWSNEIGNLNAKIFHQKAKQFRILQVGTQRQINGTQRQMDAPMHHQCPDRITNKYNPNYIETFFFIFCLLEFSDIVRRGEDSSMMRLSH